MKRSRRVVLTLMGSAAAVAPYRWASCREPAAAPAIRPYPVLTADPIAARPTAASWRRAASLRRLAATWSRRSRAWRADTFHAAHRSPSEPRRRVPTAESAGSDFHTIDGERYWDERAYYAFALDEIEHGIEAPTAEIDAMCLELVGRAIGDERLCAG